MIARTKSAGTGIGFRVKASLILLAVILVAVATPAGDSVRWWATQWFTLDEDERIADVEVAWTPEPLAPGVEANPTHLPTVNIQVHFEPAVDGGGTNDLDEISPYQVRRVVRVGTRILVYADSSPDRVGGYTCQVRIHWKGGSYFLPMAHTSAFPTMHGRWIGTVT